jgi:hypothetical protein
MMWRIYIVPIEHIDLGPGKEFAAPKYFFGRLTNGLSGMEGVVWAWERYVWENHGVVAADVSDAQHALVSAQTDVIAVPALDDVIPNASARNRVRSILEAGNIPGSWVATGMSYRVVLRTVLNVFQFFNRYVAKGGRVFVTGITLDTTISQLPAIAVTRLQETAAEFGLDTSAVTGATTLRQVFKGLADQFGDVARQIGGMVI